jgi:hypothetical protein
MQRRTFIKATSVIAGGSVLIGPSSLAQIMPGSEAPGFDRSMRWIQFAMVENDPGRFAPDYWLISS